MNTIPSAHEVIAGNQAGQLVNLQTEESQVSSFMDTYGVSHMKVNMV